MGWIEDFCEYTEGFPTAPTFRLWAGIAAVGGALERRVWALTARKQAFPNLFVMLVAPPGRGKGVIDEVESLWRDTKKYKLSAHSVTRASLVDDLGNAKQTKILAGLDGEKKLEEYHCLLAPAEEFGNLVPAHDLAFLSALNYIYNCPANYRETRRGLKDDIDIINPCLTILAGTQPAYLASLLPDEAWGMGTMSRTIMVYADELVSVPLFSDGGKSQDDFAGERKALVKSLAAFADMRGQVEFTPGAREALEDWRRNGQSPEPTHSKLANYNARRMLNCIKLSMIAAASARNSTIIEDDDICKAISWLLAAEERMPEIFRSMMGRSDKDVIEETWNYVWGIWSKQHRAVHLATISDFLLKRVTQEKVMPIITLMVKSNYFDEEMGSGAYVPRSREKLGVE